MSNQYPPQQPPQPPQQWGPQTPGSAAPPPPGSAAEKSSFFKRRWVIGVGAGFLGLILGAGLGAGGETTSADDSSSDDSAAVAKVEKERDDAQAKVAELEASAADVAKREKEVAAQEQEVAAREEAVGTAEKEAESNTIDGSGQYIVGEDMRAGTWKTKGPSDDGVGSCYYEVRKDLDADIENYITNDNISGPGVVQLKKGQVFETNGCQEWTRS